MKELWSILMLCLRSSCFLRSAVLEFGVGKGGSYFWEIHSGGGKGILFPVRRLSTIP
jgi:hypothetical protein